LLAVIGKKGRGPLVQKNGQIKDPHGLNLKLGRVDNSTQIIVSEVIDAQFVGVSEATLSKRMIIDHICNQAPLITKERGIPLDEGLFY
jgi:hypothetical protein